MVPFTAPKCNNFDSKTRYTTTVPIIACIKSYCTKTQHVHTIHNNDNTAINAQYTGNIHGTNLLTYCFKIR